MRRISAKAAQRASHSAMIGQVLAIGSERVSRITGVPWTIVPGVQTGVILLTTRTGDANAMMADPAAGGMHRRANMGVMAVAGDQEVRHGTASIAIDCTVSSC